MTEQTETIYQRVIKVLHEYFEKHHLDLPEEGFNGHSRFNEDLGLDSMEYIELFMDFEKEFNILMEDEEFGHIKTLSELLSKVESKLTIQQSEIERLKEINGA